MSQIEAVSRKWDVRRFLRRQGLELTPTETGEVHLRCPRCHDHKARLYVNQRTKNFICHNCGGRGRSAISFIKWILSCDDPHAVKVLVETADAGWRDFDEMEQELPESNDEEEITWPEAYRPLTLPMSEKSKPFWEYLIGRHITPTMVKSYEMGYCRRGPYKYRIIIPITVFGQRRGWVARSLSDTAKRKYLNPKHIHTGRLLFNIDNVVSRGSDKAVLMEGVFDALRMPDVAVCTFGKKISNHQIEILLEAGLRKLVFCYDGDALKDAAHYAETLPSYVHCYRARLPAQFDPGNAPLMVLSKAIQEAEPWHYTEPGGE